MKEFVVFPDGGLVLALESVAAIQNFGPEQTSVFLRGRSGPIETTVPFEELLQGLRLALGLEPVTEGLVAALDAILPGDVEHAHGEADDLLLSALPPEVGDAYKRLMDRCAWWATA